MRTKCEEANGLSRDEHDFCLLVRRGRCVHVGSSIADPRMVGTGATPIRIMDISRWRSGIARRHLSSASRMSEDDSAIALLDSDNSRSKIARRDYSNWNRTVFQRGRCRPSSDRGYTNGIDFLLTWNYAHMANPMVQARLDELCRKQDILPPLMVSPESIPQVRFGQSIQRERKHGRSNPR